MFDDWTEWHRHYSDASLTQRLQLTHEQLRGALADAPVDSDEVVRLVSVCAGEGRDVLPVLASHAVERRVRGLLLEQDQTVAARAESTIASLKLRDVEVRIADAGSLDTFAKIGPVDLLVASGVFGNITMADTRRTVAALPGLLAPRGVVVWTRSRRAEGHDRSAEVQSYFLEHGFTELSSAITRDGSFRVAVHRLGAATSVRSRPSGRRMFSFRTDDPKPTGTNLS